LQLPIIISNADEYRYAVSRDYQPLQDWKKFKLPVQLRIDLQREIFGKSLLSKGDVVKANQRFYYWCWDNKANYCEECAKPLHNYSSVFISHILTRGSRPEIAHDPRNVNILCYKHHEQWETGKRQLMRIYKTNLFIIELLKTDYR